MTKSPWSGMAATRSADADEPNCAWLARFTKCKMAWRSWRPVRSKPTKSTSCTAAWKSRSHKLWFWELGNDLWLCDGYLITPNSICSQNSDCEQILNKFRVSRVSICFGRAPNGVLALKATLRWVRWVDENRLHLLTFYRSGWGSSLLANFGNHGQGHWGQDPQRMSWCTSPVRVSWFCMNL